MTLQTHSDAAPIPTGIPVLDDILTGEHAGDRAHLIEGRPGSGTTTLGMQFLLAGAGQGETCLSIALSESERELLSVASRRGWSLEGIEIFERVPPELGLDPPQQRSPVHSSDLELGKTAHMALAEQPFIVLRMHELLTCLNQQGVVTILILAQHGMVGQMVSPVDLTFLSDAVVMLRFFEADGRIRRALSVGKRRTGQRASLLEERETDNDAGR